MSDVNLKKYEIAVWLSIKNWASTEIDTRTASTRRGAGRYLSIRFKNRLEMTKTRASRVTACLINYKIDCITTEGEDSTFRRSKGNSFQLFVA